MAITAVVTKLNNNTKFQLGEYFVCHGRITFGGSDTYVTGGFSVSAQIRRVFGVRNVEALAFLGCMSDGVGGTVITTAAAQGRFDAQTDRVKLYVFGRTVGSPGTAQASEVEIANGAGVDAGVLDFVAYCKGSGISAANT